jgi:hypothetical protein
MLGAHGSGPERIGRLDRMHARCGACERDAYSGGRGTDAMHIWATGEWMGCMLG